MIDKHRSETYQARALSADQDPRFSEVATQTRGKERSEDEQRGCCETNPRCPNMVPIGRQTDEEKHNGALCEIYGKEIEDVASVFALGDVSFTSGGAKRWSWRTFCKATSPNGETSSMVFPSP